jgi:hypothetical protein
MLIRRAPAFTTVLVILLMLLTPWESAGQIPFMAAPCPHQILPNTLGYNGFIEFMGLQFPVTRLYTITPGLRWVTYATDPATPRVGTAEWRMAAVGVHCYWWVLGIIGEDILVVEEYTKYGYIYKVDPIACAPGTGTGGTSLVSEVSYDPYEPGPAPCSGSSGDSEGSGTYYSPGDPTGGETVDFGSGQGNGGTSICGAAAVVEYVCIDVWNETMGRWEEWTCGYVTSC